MTPTQSSSSTLFWKGVYFCATAFAAAKLIGHFLEKQRFKEDLEDWLYYNPSVKRVASEIVETTAPILSNLAAAPEGKLSYELDLADSKITTLPPLYNPGKIVVLKADGNILTMTPSLERYASLRFLSLSSCGLKMLPNLFQLPHLTHANFRDNEITEFPQNMHQLHPHLLLNLSYNQVQESPDEVKTWSTQTIDLTFNPLSEKAKRKLHTQPSILL